MAFSSFSAHRIKRPRTGMWSMHPFVDVLEDRSFMCAAVHDGVLSVEMVGEGTDLVTPDRTGATGEDRTVDANHGRPDRPRRAAGDGVLTLHEPMRVDLNAADGRSAFSATPIGTGDDVMFGNLLHDRRGRTGPRALPSPTSGDAQSATGRPGGPFRDGRPLTGAMRPYLTAAVHNKAGAFAA